MKKMVVVLTWFFVNIFSVASARGEVLATEQLLTPLSPESVSNASIHVPKPFDPNKPVWVVYQLVAVSAASNPEGEIVIDSSFEGVPTPINDSVVILKARDLKIDHSAGELESQLQALVGKRSPEELIEIFGEDLYEAYAALNKKEGAYITGNIIKMYNPGGRTDLVLLASVERASGIQPVLINIIVGQGDIPKQYQDSSGSLAKDKLVAVIIGLLVIVFFLFMRRR